MFQLFQHDVTELKLHTRFSKGALKTLDSTVELLYNSRLITTLACVMVPYIQTGGYEQYIIIIDSDWSKSGPNKPACIYQRSMIQLIECEGGKWG